MSDEPWHPVLDPGVLESIVELTPEWIAILLAALTHLGSVFVVVPVAILAYWWEPERLGTWLGAVFAYYGLMASIKALNDATRPDVAPPVGPEPFPAVFTPWYSHATSISTTSFPSGNAMVATLVVCLMVYDLRIGTYRSRALVGGFVVAVVGYSRLGMGVHYPVDVVGGFALALFGVIVFVRNRVDDEIAAVFAIAAAVTLFNIWIRSNGLGVPTVDGIQGRNRNVAFAGAVGGLLVWRLGHATDWQFGTPLGRIGLSAIFGTGVVIMYAVHMTVSHPLVTMAWGAIVFGMIVALPYVRPRLDDLGVVSGVSRTA